MSATISLVVPVCNAGDALPKHLAALDRQTLPADQWEVIYVDGGSTDLTPPRLETLARYRPNAIVRTVPRTATGWDQIGAGLEAASGTWILLSDVRDELTRAALERLAAGAEAHPDASAVVARSVDHARTGVDDRLFAHPQLDPAHHASALLAPAVLHRRDNLTSAEGLAGPFPAAQLAVRVADTRRPVALVSGYPVLIGSGLRGAMKDADRVHDLLAAMSTMPSPQTLAGSLAWALGALGERLGGMDRLPEIVERAGELVDGLPPGPERVLLDLVGRGRHHLAARVASHLRSLTLTDRHTDVAWSGDRVSMRAEGVLTLDPGLVHDLSGSTVAELLAAATPRLGLRNRHTTSIYPVNEAQARSVRLDGNRATVVVEAEIDPRTLDGGGVLPRAAYQVVLEVLGLGWGAVPQTTLRAGVDLPAVLGDTLATVRAVAKAGLHMDVNAARRALLGRLPADASSVTDSAHGSLLTMPVPNLVVADASGSVEGSVLLGGLPFRARLVLDDPARVECLVSGLPGRVEIKTRFGLGPAASTGCELVARPDGTFIVRAFQGASSADVASTVATARSPRRTGTPGTPQAAAPGPAAVKPPPAPAAPHGVGAVKDVLKRVPGLRRGVRAGRRVLRQARRRIPARG